MAIPMVLTSSDSFTGSMKYNRFGGPIFSGTVYDGAATGGPRPAPGAVALIQSTAPLLTQLVSTAAPSRAAYVYIPQTTGGIATSSFASGEGAPPYSAMGAALIWDAANARLGVYSTASGSGVWLFTNIITASSGTAPFTSS